MQTRLNAISGDQSGRKTCLIVRKIWLFSDTPAGAHSSAIIYSLMQTAMANGKEPYAWMRYIMEQLPTYQSAEQIEQLLPWNCEPPIYR